MATSEPIVRLDPQGKATVLSYNVPDRTSYSGRNTIELPIDPGWFKPIPAEAGKEAEAPFKGQDLATVRATVVAAMRSGFADARLFPKARIGTDALRFNVAPNPGTAPANPHLLSSSFARLDPDFLAARLQQGDRLAVHRSMYGTYKPMFLPPPPPRKPRMLIIETYCLSSFLGNYGAGRVLKTFSLLPGEKTKISIKTFSKTESELKQASSVLDSFTEESASDFEDSLQSENSDKESRQNSFEYHAEAEASASWGWGKAKVSGGVKGGSNAAREQFAKNVSSAVQKHSAKASAKRDVQINTSYETKATEQEETAVERQIENINVSRTLNFVFRQMNQEFITILHLVDVRVAYFDGRAESRREVPLYELDDLLTDVMPDAAKVKTVRGQIVGELASVFDYKGQVHSIVEEQPLLQPNGQPSSTEKYLRIPPTLSMTYTDESGNQMTVPGIIVAATKNTMRTEGVIVEALLGLGDALDEYSHGLQDESVRTRKLSNETTQQRIDQGAKALDIVDSKDDAAAAVFVKVFPPADGKEGNHGPP